jgi:uncharacterized low-complexity protein
MNTKVFALIAIITLTVTLITAAMTTTNAFASHRHHNHGSSNSQSLAQSNACGGNSKCSSIGSQIQGDRNSVSIASSQ